MTRALFEYDIAFILTNALVWAWLLSRRFVGRTFKLPDRIEAGSAGTVAVMFSLFLAFSTSDIVQRSRDLNLAVQKEVSLARSIFKFSEAVGESAGPVREALIEYMQAVTTLEEAWLDGPGKDDSPAQDASDTMVQVATLFVVQSPAPPAVKSLIVTKVDEMRQARTERITLSRSSSGIPQWLVLTLVASITQIVIILGYIERPTSQRLVVGLFTFAAIGAMCYLAFLDGLIGPSKIAASLRPLSDLAQAAMASQDQ